MSLRGKRWLRTLLSFDYLLAVAVAGLAAFGVVMIYAATHTGVTPYYESMYTSQRLYAITGAALMLIFAAVDYRFITRFYWLIYALCVALLVAVLLIGADDTGTARWIWLPALPGIGIMSIQPSEFAKVFMILFLAKLIEVRKDVFNHLLILGIILFCIVLPVLLIQQQPSLSASLVIVFTGLVILFTAGLYYRTIFIGLALGLPLVLAAWFDLRRAEPVFIKRILNDYQWGRVAVFLNPVPGSDEYMQIQGSLQAIGSGGLYGKGFMQNDYIIFGHNDLIFSVVATQFGFVGCAVLLGVMAFIIIKCILTALRACDLQGRLIAAGVAGMLIFETFVNVGVAMDMLPTTGMAFPFLSYGGSVMWVHMMAIGLVLNIGLPREKSMFEAESEF